MCPSAPRVCSKPGGQRPVLSLSLDLIIPCILVCPIFTSLTMFCFCQVLLYSPFPDKAMTHYSEWSWCRWKVSFKKVWTFGVRVVCTSPSRLTSYWVSMMEAAVSFEVLYFLFKGPKISEEKCKRYVLSDFVTMKAPLWKHPMPLGLRRKKLSSVLNWFKDQLDYKIISKA